MAAKGKRTWRQKLADDMGLPRVQPINEKMSRKCGHGTMVIPAPKEVDEIMGAVPEGRLITVGGIMKILAQRHGATICCPLTTGIFVWIAAHAADEAMTEGKEPATAFWRTLKTGGELNPKYPGGVERQKLLLEAEGHRVFQRGKKHMVDNLQAVLLGAGRGASK